MLKGNVINCGMLVIIDSSFDFVQALGTFGAALLLLLDRF